MSTRARTVPLTEETLPADETEVGPKLVECMSTAANLPVEHLSRSLKSLIALVVSQDNSCRYCVQSTRFTMLASGFSQREVQNILADLYGPSLPEGDRAALTFARRLSRSNPRPAPDELRALQDHGFTAPAITEIAAVTAATIVANRIGTASNLQPMHIPDNVDRWYHTFTRLIARRRINRERRLRNARARESSEYDGPGARLLDSLPDVPAVHGFRHILRLAWGESTIPLRTRAMMAGIVGRLVQCGVSQQIARYWLERGGLSGDEVEALFARLDTRSLHASDRRVLELARTSVRVQNPAPLVRQTRALSEQDSTEVADDAILFLAVANAMCRFTVVQGVN